MSLWDKDDLSNALNVKVKFDAQDFCSNSKEVKQGDLFIALRRQKDGHIYIQEALDKGASVVVADYLPNDVKQDDRIVIVDDTYIALKNLAIYRRNQSKAKFISITGSCGKTSTKFHLTEILSKFGKAVCSKASFNNHFGVPLTLAALPWDADYVIIEIGTNHHGEIAPLAQMVKADIAIITNVLHAHIGNFASFHDLVYEKAQIFNDVRLACIFHRNQDDKAFNIIRTEVVKNKLKDIFIFGNEDSDAKVINYKLIDNLSARVEIIIQNKVLGYQTRVTGRHFADNFLAIALVCNYLELDMKKALKAFEQLDFIDGRGKTFSSNKFGKVFQVIDDAYNANPSSIRSSLENLAQTNYPRKVVVLSDMLELGNESASFHRGLSSALSASGAYKFIAVGDMMKILYDAVENIEKYAFENSEELLKNIGSLIDDGDVLLFKGSRSTKLFTIVDYLK